MYTPSLTQLLSLFFSAATVWLLSACQPAGSSEEPSWANDKEFTDYWYQGKAEVSSYELNQARYGAMHPGHAVLIFVTEDFSEEKQVKLDRPEEAGSDAVKVMKLNKVKKFDTGIYPYSMMTSTFTPLNTERYPRSLKVTTTSQEWCGHTFTQMNLDGNHYNTHLYSYFEAEGDQQLNLDAVLLEDEVWNQIRMNPESLPNGEIEIIPGTMYQRLSHEPLKVVKANANLTREEEESIYTLDYPTLNRTLMIHFQTAFPHKILGWKETFRSGFGENAQNLTTTATLDETLLIDYWTKNTPQDSVLRMELQLP